VLISSDLHGSMMRVMESSLSRLETIWHEMGLTGDALNDRRHSVLTNHQTLFRDVIAEEKKHLQDTVDCIKSYQVSITKMSEELHQPPTAKVPYMTSHYLSCSYVADPFHHRLF